MTRRSGRTPAVLLLGAITALGPLLPAPVAAGGPVVESDAAPTWGEPTDLVTANGRRLRPEARPGPQPETTGRILVRWRSAAGPAQRVALMSRVGVAQDRSAPPLDAWQVLTPAGDLDAAVTALRRDPAVSWAEPEYRRDLSVVDIQEPLYPEQWSLNNTGQDIGGFSGAPNVDMNLPEAWELGMGSPDVTVAVIDTGVDFDHPELQGTAWVNPGESGGGKETNGVDDDANGFIDDVNGWDFCHNDSSVFEVEDGWHGTAMASLIAGSVVMAGMIGVAPGVKIMALKIFDAGGDCGTAAEVAALEYAADHGIKIVNASYGGGGFSVAERDAILAAQAATGLLFVASAGNQGADIDATPSYPASYDIDNILTVAAIHNEGMLSGCTPNGACSNFGATAVDMSAPGEAILIGATVAQPVPHVFGLVAGTSPAAANVSGVAALVGSIRPDLFTGALLKQRLMATGKPIPWTRGVTATGRIPDARAALVGEPDIRRLSGINRNATAAAISEATYFRYPQFVVVATGAGFADALAGGAVGAQFGYPLLLVNQGSIPAETASELTRLQPLNIVVLGGTGVVSAQVESQLAAFVFGDGEVVRLAGPDRFATAVAVSEGFEPGVETAYIATGLNFPDALGAAPPSALSGGPLLLVLPNAIPAVVANELDRLDPGRIVVLGGTGVVSNAVMTQLDAITSGPVFRVAGGTRYETAVAISSTFFGAAESVFVATGLNFPDALAGGSSGGAYIGPLLLVPGTSVPASVQGELLRFQPARVFILGGTGVVSDSVVTQIGNLFP